MSKSIHCVRLNHMNVVYEDFDASVAHLQTLYGADFIADIPQREWHACLVDIGRGLFELFVPHEFLLNSRYGPHYVGIEYQADMDEVREVVAAHNLRIIRDIGIALHTHPDDGFGIAFEFFGDYFHDRDWPLLGGGKIKPAGYWRDDHPLGLTGLKGYTVGVRDIDAASAFFRSFLSCDIVYEEARPAIAARAIGLQVSDSVVELITPVGEGTLQRHLLRFGDGIYSTIFGVRDLEQARQYFAERGVDVVAGGAPNSLAVPAEQNRGVVFEFAQ